MRNRLTFANVIGVLLENEKKPTRSTCLTQMLSFVML